MTLTREEALDRLNEMYEEHRPFTGAEYAEALDLVNIIQDAIEAEMNEPDQPDDDEVGPLTALMSDSQREQMVRI